MNSFEKSRPEQGSGDLSGWESLAREASSEGNTASDENSIEKIRENVVDMTKVGEGFLKQDFASGVYLFHSAKVEQIDKIFESGSIMNAGAIYERRIEHERKRLLGEGKTISETEHELKKIMIDHNSGQEGISWSANGIDAMPGTTGHIAGFVAAPEMVLGKDKLVVPSRPAPYELVQVSEEVDAVKFYEAKKQFEVWGYKDVSLGEKASVDSGMLALILTAKDRKDENPTSFFSSQLEKFKDRGGLRAEELRKNYEIEDDGRIKINEDLHQQKFDDNYLPPAAVFMQALVDRGDFKDSLADGKDVNEIIDMCFEYDNLPLFILGKARQESKQYLDAYEAELEKAKSTSVNVEDMFFVTSRRDLDGWIKKMQETGHVPKGVLLYDDDKVVKENFAQLEPGDNMELAQEIGRVIGVDEEFWREKVGMNVEEIERAGHRGQVLKDSEVEHEVEVKMADEELRVFRH